MVVYIDRLFVLHLLTEGILLRALHVVMPSAMKKRCYALWTTVNALLTTGLICIGIYAEVYANAWYHVLIVGTLFFAIFAEVRGNICARAKAFLRYAGLTIALGAVRAVLVLLLGRESNTFFEELCMTGIGGVILIGGMREVQRRRRQRNFSCEVRLRWAGRFWTVKGYCDTGNFLKYKGKGVYVAARGLFEEMAGDVEKPVMVPYIMANGGCGMLRGICVEAIEVMCDGRAVFKEHNAIVACGDEKFSMKSEVLLPEGLVEYL